MTSPMGMPRRKFIAASAVSALAAANFARAQEKSPGWIDAHVHVWTPDLEKYPLANGYEISDMQPPSFTPQQLFSHTQPSGVDRIVLIQMSYYRDDNQYMLDVIEQHPGVFSGVGIVDHHDKDVAAKMRDLARRGVRGFRIATRGVNAADWLEDEGMARLWRTAREENLAVCPLINPADLPHIDAMCKKFEGTRVVVDHFARVGIKGEVVPRELDALCRLARFEDVCVKTSAFYALGQKRPPYKDLAPMIRRVVDAFGPSRLMWASDCPFQVQGEHSYEASLALIRDRLDFLSISDKNQILRSTAQRVFFA